MFNNLQALGLGLIGFAIIIGVGTVVLHQFGGAIANCSNVTDGAWDTATNTCINSSGTASPPSGTGFESIDYLNTQLGETGLAGWTPAVIAISVGMLFLGVFLTRGGRKV